MLACRYFIYPNPVIGFRSRGFSYVATLLYEFLVSPKNRLRDKSFSLPQSDASFYAVPIPAISAEFLLNIHWLLNCHIRKKCPLGNLVPQIKPCHIMVESASSIGCYHNFSLATASRSFFLVFSAFAPCCVMHPPFKST